MKTFDVESIDARKISLHDENHIWDHVGFDPSNSVDKVDFIKTLRRSRWYGPY